MITGFVYIWRDRKHKRYCLGSHYGSLDDGYVTSTGWMMRAFKKRPEDFTRRILYYHYGDHKSLLENEQKWLNLIDRSELSKKYYNHKPFATGGGMYGKKHSEETKEKMRNYAKSRDLSHLHTPEVAEKRVSKLKGQKRSKDFCDHLSKVRTGVKTGPLSDETKLKMSSARKGVKRGPYKKRINIANDNKNL